MAKSGFAEIITVALVGVAGYLGWNWYQSQTVPVTPVTPATPANPAVYVPPTTTQQMQTAANANSFIQGQGGQGDAYQWSTIWNQIGKTAIPNVNALFFPNGLPSSASQVTQAGGTASSQGLPLMTLAQFMSTIQGAGISGLGQVNGKTLIPVPVLIGGQPRNINVPFGTTPASLQRMMRSRR